MKTPFLRRTASLMAAVMMFAVVAPPAIQAAEIQARHSQEEGRVQKIKRAAAQKIYKGVVKAVNSIVKAANKSDRVNLKTEMIFLDKENRIFFDIKGMTRVKVPGKKWLKKIQTLKDEQGTYTIASNGPVAVDVAATPVKIEGKEVSFAVQLDMAIQLGPLGRLLGENSIGFAGALGLGPLFDHMSEALDAFDGRIIGDAIGTGVAEMSKLLGEGKEEPFGDRASVSRHNGRGVTGMSLLRHFAVSIAYVGSIAGARLGGKSLGAMIAVAVFPAGVAFIPTMLGSAVGLWFGTWIVKTVLINIPIKWKFRKLEKLYKQNRLEKLAVYQSGVVERLQQEMDRPRDRWVFFELMKNHLKKKMDESDGNYDLTPFQPLIDRAKQVLQYRAVNDGDWYGARMYYQLLAAIRQLPAVQKVPASR
jgi:hypothetical protein